MRAVYQQISEEMVTLCSSDECEKKVGAAIPWTLINVKAKAGKAKERVA